MDSTNFNVTSDSSPVDIGFAGSIYQAIVLSPGLSVFLLLSTIFLISASTRFLSGQQAHQNGPVKSVPSIPYWTPVLGHVFGFLYDPISLMNDARDQTAHGIFSLKLGPTVHNVVSNPELVKNIMQQKESVVRFKPIAWTVMERFFGVPTTMKDRYFDIWEKLHHCVVKTLMQEPYLGETLKVVIDILQENIPNMISFMDSTIDQQPWEKSSDCELVTSNPPTAEVDLFQLMRDMMGYASVPSLFGKAFTEVNPHILQDIYAMDYGFKWLMTGLPRWFPFPPVIAAHIARKNAVDSITGFFEAYDAILEGKPSNPAWGEMDDVSELVKMRTAFYREYGFAPKDRADISILWALTVNANVCVYWQLLHILATDGLADRIRQEIKPYVIVQQPLCINGISEAPKLTISHEGLAKRCPLFKASFYETNRLCNQPWSVRQAEQDVVISTKPANSSHSESFSIKSGEFITIPHELHMLDHHYYKEPHKFIPERFIKIDETGVASVDIGTIRPFGGGPSMCKGRTYAERECLSLVAGVLTMYDFEPAGNKGWVIPGQRKATAITLPKHDTRVRIRKRQFGWERA